MGHEACLRAVDINDAMGNVGAGTGATVENFWVTNSR